MLLQQADMRLMMTRPGAISIACNFGIGLLALVLASPNSPAQAQSADLVLCDRVAADPADPDKPADVQGVREIAQSDIATAIKFCRMASASSRRALYQLGRAYAANRQIAGSRQRLSQGGRQGQHVGHGRTRRDARRPARALPRTRRRRASCSSARPRPAIRAASPISRRSRRRRTVGSGQPAAVGSRQGASAAVRKRRRPIRRKRSISSA